MNEGKTKRNSKKVLTEEQIKTTLEESDGDITLHEVGELYGITRMRVCQIEKNSLKKLSKLDDLKDLM